MFSGERGTSGREQRSMSAQETERNVTPQEGMLILVSPDGRAIEVRDGDVVGRTAVGREVLDIHEEISRRHVRFVRSEGTWFVIDLNSSNGTFLDGNRISPGERIPLQNGQQISISPVFVAAVRTRETEIADAALPSQGDGVEQEHPNRKTMVILFADLKGSVDFFQEKGTIVAQKWILNLYRLLSTIISTHRGEHIKNIGDAILAVFDDPHEAARAALKMQADIRTHNGKADNMGQYYLRIGMNMGNVLVENRDVFGNAVNIAARVQAVAPPEHIYITQRLYDEVKDDRDMEFRLISHEQLKGVKEKTTIYEIVCAHEKKGGGF